ncbi:MAG: hypothetical protein HeimC3_39790 [Candidatus Heimdallarchaeota archaeon LC_3]|nr:MAG: hypothetical protein HeimC3_39790 [Candidatus Heimdallarchaeota archaeon LC_3]
MIIKDLFIVSNEGRTYYHYKSATSNYNIDLNLFSGFVAALSVFTSSLSEQKKIEFLKLQDDEMYFTVEQDIIVASIMAVSGVEQRVIEYLMKFVGKKFLDKHFVNMKKPGFNWDSITEAFTKEIEDVWSTDDVYEETKRELISEFMAKSLEGELSPELLQWKITSLFLGSTPDEVEKTLGKVYRFKEDLFSMTNDPILRAGLTEALDNIIQDLSKILPKKSGSLLVITDNRDHYELLYRKCLGYHLFCIPVKTIDDLKSIVTFWKDETSYSIVYMNPTISIEEYRKLKSIPSKGKIFVWINKIPTELRDKSASHHNIKLSHQLPSFSEMFSKIMKESELIEAT